MAFLDFGLARGLAYKYDWGARFNRQRQQAEYDRQSKEEEYQHQQDAKLLEQRKKQLDFARDDKVQAEMNVLSQNEFIKPYDIRFQNKFDQQVSSQASAIGKILNTPGYSQKPELMKELNDSMAKATDMTKFVPEINAHNQYEAAIKDYKEGKIDDTEMEKVKEDYQKFNEGGKDFSYIPKQKFYIVNEIDKYLGELTAKTITDEKTNSTIKYLEIGRAHV